jgi:hypothetical protein
MANAVHPTTEHFRLLRQPTFVLPEPLVLSRVTAPGTGLVTERITAAMLIALPTRPRHQLTASAVLPMEERLPALPHLTFALPEPLVLSQAAVPGTGHAMARTEAAMPTVPLTRPRRQLMASAVLQTAELFTMLRPIIYVLPEMPALFPAQALGTGHATARTEAATLIVMPTKPSR